MNTPVFLPASAWRSTAVLRPPRRGTTRRRPPGVRCPPVQTSLVPSGHAAGTSSSSGCSGATTTNVAPNSVSGRVVNTSTWSPPWTANRTRGARGPADPVALHRLDLLGPVDVLQVVDEPVGVGRDPHVPLPQAALEHREVAALRAPVGGDLLVGQHGAQTRAPVHGRLGDVRQAVRVQHAPARDASRSAHRRPPRPAHRSRTPRPARRSAAPGRRRRRPWLVVPGVEDLQEDPLRPAHVARGRSSRTSGAGRAPARAGAAGAA